MKFNWLKLTASLTCFFFSAFDLSAYAAPISGYSQLSLNAPATIRSTGSFPVSLAISDEFFEGSSLNSKEVVFIQDAHSSLEAQKNIASTIHWFVKNRGVRKVYEEGFSGKVPTDSVLNASSNRHDRKIISSELLAHLLIGGAEYAHINRIHDFDLIGVDNTQEHLRGIRAFAEAQHWIDETNQDWAWIDAYLEKSAIKLYPKSLYTWLKLKRSFDSHTLDLFTYLKRSAVLLPADKLRQFPQIQQLLLWESKPELRTDGNPDVNGLLHEISLMEHELARIFLSGRPQALHLFRLQTGVSLLKQLGKLQITGRDFSKLRTMLPHLRSAKLAAFFAEVLGETVVLSTFWEKTIRSAMIFYETVRRRDQTVKRHLEDFLRAPDEGPLVLVFGGFHREPLTRFLRAKGVRFTVLAPRIEDSSSAEHSLYIERMTQDFRDLSHQTSRPVSIFHWPTAATVRFIEKLRMQLLPPKAAPLNPEDLLRDGKIPIDKIADPRVKRFLTLLNNHGLHEILLTGGAVLSAIRGLPAKDLDVTVQIPFTDEDLRSLEKRPGTATPHMIAESMKALRRLAEALQTRPENLLPRSGAKPFRFEGLKVDFMGPAVLVKPDGSETPLRRIVGNQGAREMLASRIHVLRLTLEPSGKFFDSHEGLIDLRDKILRLKPGHGTPLTFRGVLRLFRLKHSLGLRFTPETESTLRQTLAKFSEHPQADRETAEEEFLQILRRAQDKQAAQADLDAYGIPQLIRRIQPVPNNEQGKFIVRSELRNWLETLPEKAYHLVADSVWLNHLPITAQQWLIGVAGASLIGLMGLLYIKHRYLQYPSFQARWRMSKETAKEDFLAIAQVVWFPIWFPVILGLGLSALMFFIPIVIAIAGLYEFITEEPKEAARAGLTLSKVLINFSTVNAIAWAGLFSGKFLKAAWGHKPETIDLLDPGVLATIAPEELVKRAKTVNGYEKGQAEGTQAIQELIRRNAFGHLLKVYIHTSSAAAKNHLQETGKTDLPSFSSYAYGSHASARDGGLEVADYLIKHPEFVRTDLLQNVFYRLPSAGIQEVQKRLKAADQLMALGVSFDVLSEFLFHSKLPEIVIHLELAIHLITQGYWKNTEFKSKMSEIANSVVAVSHYEKITSLIRNELTERRMTAEQIIPALAALTGLYARMKEETSSYSYSYSTPAKKNPEPAAVFAFAAREHKRLDLARLQHASGVMIASANYASGAAEAFEYLEKLPDHFLNRHLGSVASFAPQSGQSTIPALKTAKSLWEEGIIEETDLDLAARRFGILFNRIYMDEQRRAALIGDFKSGIFNLEDFGALETHTQSLLSLDVFTYLKRNRVEEHRDSNRLTERIEFILGMGSQTPDSGIFRNSIKLFIDTVSTSTVADLSRFAEATVALMNETAQRISPRYSVDDYDAYGALTGSHDEDNPSYQEAVNSAAVELAAHPERWPARSELRAGVHEWLTTAAPFAAGITALAVGTFWWGYRKIRSQYERHSKVPSFKRQWHDLRTSVPTESNEDFFLNELLMYLAGLPIAFNIFMFLAPWLWTKFEYNEASNTLSPNSVYPLLWLGSWVGLFFTALFSFVLVLTIPLYVLKLVRLINYTPLPITRRSSAELTAMDIPELLKLAEGLNGLENEQALGQQAFEEMARRKDLTAMLRGASKINFEEWPPVISAFASIGITLAAPASAYTSEGKWLAVLADALDQNPALPRSPEYFEQIYFPLGKNLQPGISYLNTLLAFEAQGFRGAARLKIIAHAALKPKSIFQKESALRYLLDQLTAETLLPLTLERKAQSLAEVVQDEKVLALIFAIILHDNLIISEEALDMALSVAEKSSYRQLDFFTPFKTGVDNGRWRFADIERVAALSNRSADTRYSSLDSTLLKLASSVSSEGLLSKEALDQLFTAARTAWDTAHGQVQGRILDYVSQTPRTFQDIQRVNAAYVLIRSRLGEVIQETEELPSYGPYGEYLGTYTSEREEFRDFMAAALDLLLVKHSPLEEENAVAAEVVKTMADTDAARAAASQLLERMYPARSELRFEIDYHKVLSVSAPYASLFFGVASAAVLIIQSKLQKAKSRFYSVPSFQPLERHFASADTNNNVFNPYGFSLATSPLTIGFLWLLTYLTSFLPLSSAQGLKEQFVSLALFAGTFGFGITFMLALGQLAEGLSLLPHAMRIIFFRPQEIVRRSASALSALPPAQLIENTIGLNQFEADIVRGTEAFEEIARRKDLLTFLRAAAQIKDKSPKDALLKAAESFGIPKDKLGSLGWLSWLADEIETRGTAYQSVDYFKEVYLPIGLLHFYQEDHRRIYFTRVMGFESLGFKGPEALAVIVGLNSRGSGVFSREGALKTLQEFLGTGTLSPSQLKSFAGDFSQSIQSEEILKSVLEISKDSNGKVSDLRLRSLLPIAKHLGYSAGNFLNPFATGIRNGIWQFNHLNDLYTIYGKNADPVRNDLLFIAAHAVPDQPIEKGQDLESYFNAVKQAYDAASWDLKQATFRDFFTRRTRTTLADFTRLSQSFSALYDRYYETEEVPQTGPYGEDWGTSTQQTYDSQRTIENGYTFLLGITDSPYPDAQTAVTRFAAARSELRQTQSLEATARIRRTVRNQMNAATVFLDFQDLTAFSPAQQDEIIKLALSLRSKIQVVIYGAHPEVQESVYALWSTVSRQSRNIILSPANRNHVLKSFYRENRTTLHLSGMRPEGNRILLRETAPFRNLRLFEYSSADEVGLLSVALLYPNLEALFQKSRIVKLSMLDSALVSKVQEYLATLIVARSA